jgi:N-acetylglutamate synthase-like GNAT family acetyltransferase
MITLKQITSVRDEDFGYGIQILHKYIPHNLCIDSNELIYWIDNYNTKFEDKMYVYVIKSNNDVIGYLQFTHFINKFVFLDYLIVMKNSRTKERMKDIYEQVYNEIYKTGCKSIVLECGNEMNQHDAIVRLYEIMGFNKFNVDYKEPKIDVDLVNQKLSWQELPSTLMSNDTGLISLNVIRTIYFDHYLRWYSLYGMDYTDYISFLHKLIDKYISTIVLIGEMREEDIQKCAELIVGVYQKDGIWLNWTVEDTVRDLKIAFDNPKYKEKYLVARLNGEIIGIAGVAESFMTCAAFELCYATVKHEYQRQGIGTQLTLARIDYIKRFKEHGYIFVSSRYPKFFDKLGFKQVVSKDGEDDAGSGAFCCLKF